MTFKRNKSILKEMKEVKRNKSSLKEMKEV
jgi:hypothetical protein